MRDRTQSKCWIYLGVLLNLDHLERTPLFSTTPIPSSFSLDPLYSGLLRVIPLEVSHARKLCGQVLP